MHNFGGSNNSRKNYMRVAEVWLDEYRDHFYEKVGYKHNKEAAVCFLLLAIFLFIFVKLAQVNCPVI